jgi:hypothetical protein
MLKLCRNLHLDLNIEQLNLFVSDKKVFSTSGAPCSIEEFFNKSEGDFYVTQDDFSYLLSSYLISLYGERDDLSLLIDTISDFVVLSGAINDRSYFDKKLTLVPATPEKIKHVPSFEYLYGDYLAKGKDSKYYDVFIQEVEYIGCRHFLYMNCGALNAMFTSSFGLKNSIPDSMEAIFHDVIPNPKSVLEMFNSPALKILHDEKLPILNYWDCDPVTTSNYLLEEYGESRLKDFWYRLLAQRLPAFLYRKEPDWLDRLFDERSKAIKTKDWESFISSESGLRFSLYYSNVKEFRKDYNRMIIDFFYQAPASWHLR